MILDPCLPALHHTAATLRAWSVWTRAHPWWHAPARAVSGPCSRAAALAFPLLAAPGAAGPLLAAPAAPALPWIGAPGWVQTALPFGPGGYAGGFGGYGYAGGTGFALGRPLALVPGGLPAVGTAYTIPEPVSGRPLLGSVFLRVEADRDRYLGGPAGWSGVPTPEGPARAGGGYPPLVSDVPTSVPEPAALDVVLAGLLAVAVWRRRG